ncbi:MAG: SemiSWEET transporter [Proteobacteria bacterium]|nr:SemiSWEET transporter [Pseudomonadota bacterium]
MNPETTLGLAAGLLTTMAFLPQVWQVWKSRSARDISLPMYLIFTLGVALWLVYGLMTAAVPIIVANAVTLLFAGAVLIMKLRFG